MFDKKLFYAINGNSKDPYLIGRLDEILNGRKIDFLFIDFIGPCPCFLDRDGKSDSTWIGTV